MWKKVLLMLCSTSLVLRTCVTTSDDHAKYCNVFKGTTFDYDTFVTPFLAEADINEPLEFLQHVISKVHSSCNIEDESVSADALNVLRLHGIEFLHHFLSFESRQFTELASKFCSCNASTYLGEYSELDSKIGLLNCKKDGICMNGMKFLTEYGCCSSVGDAFNSCAERVHKKLKQERIKNYCDLSFSLALKKNEVTSSIDDEYSAKLRRMCTNKCFFPAEDSQDAARSRRHVNIAQRWARSPRNSRRRQFLSNRCEDGTIYENGMLKVKNQVFHACSAVPMCLVDHPIFLGFQSEVSDSFVQQKVNECCSLNGAVPATIDDISDNIMTCFADTGLSDHFGFFANIFRNLVRSLNGIDTTCDITDTIASDREFRNPDVIDAQAVFWFLDHTRENAVARNEAVEACYDGQEQGKTLGLPLGLTCGAVAQNKIKSEDEYPILKMLTFKYCCVYSSLRRFGLPAHTGTEECYVGELW